MRVKATFESLSHQKLPKIALPDVTTKAEALRYLLKDNVPGEFPFTGGVFHVGANEVGLYGGWSLTEEKLIVADGRWTVAGLADKAPRLLEGRGNLASVITSIGDTFKGYGKRSPTA